MLRRVVNLVYGALLDDPAVVEHSHAVTELVDDGQVVGDEEIGQTQPDLQVGQQL